MSEPKEILALQLEIQSAVEIIRPSLNRYSVGPNFSKIVFDRETMCWKVYSRKSNKVALVGANNVKGVILAPEDGAPVVEKKQRPPALKAVA